MSGLALGSGVNKYPEIATKQKILLVEAKRAKRVKSVNVFNLDAGVIRNGILALRLLWHPRDFL
jgi:hypothetical protein